MNSNPSWEANKINNLRWFPSGLTGARSPRQVRFGLPVPLGELPEPAGCYRPRAVRGEPPSV